MTEQRIRFAYGANYEQAMGVWSRLATRRWTGRDRCDEMRAVGVASSRPPQVGVSRQDALRDLWKGAGLEAVETREITVRRTFADFDDFWAINLKGAIVGPAIATMNPAEADKLKERARLRLAADADGRITYGARANAIKGRVPRN